MVKFYNLFKTSSELLQDYFKTSTLTLLRRGGGGQMAHSKFLQPNVRLTSNQAVFLSLSVVSDRQGSPDISLAGKILGSIWSSMKVH